MNNDDENLNLPPENGDGNAPEGGKMPLYAAVTLILAGAVMFGLSFTFMAIYALISSIICELAALAFLRAQKKKNNLSYLKYFTIAAYVVLAAGVILFIGGIIYAATR